jgi:uncharacterized membrane protein YecN with MAPEG domain
MLITPAYAAVFALLFVALSLRTIRLRRRLRVAVGDGGEPQLLRAARVHSNFAEYVPFALVLIYFLEIEAAGNAWVHGLCLALLAGRLLHAWGVSQVKENYRFRTAGMVLTFTVILSAAFRLLYAYAAVLGG